MPISYNKLKNFQECALKIDFRPSHSYAIVDYKLDKKLPEGNAAHESQQLSFYHLLVSEGLGVEAEEVRLYFLRHGIEHISTRSRQQMRDTVAWVDETAAAIHSEKQWQPQQGKNS